MLSRGARKISICIDASRVPSPLSSGRRVVPLRHGHGHGLTARTVNTAQGSTIVQTVRQAGSGVRLLRPECNVVKLGSCELGPCNCKRLPELRFLSEIELIHVEFIYNFCELAKFAPQH